MARDKKKHRGGTPANEKRPPEHTAALCGPGGPCPSESFNQSIEENGYAIHTAPTAPCECSLVGVLISHKK
jgi:hypothetical protein